jgi:hypothetical protein
MNISQQKRRATYGPLPTNVKPAKSGDDVTVLPKIEPGDGRKLITPQKEQKSFHEYSSRN